MSRPYCNDLVRNPKGYVVSKAASAKAKLLRPAGFDLWAKARDNVRADNAIRLLLTSCLYIMCEKCFVSPLLSRIETCLTRSRLVVIERLRVAVMERLGAGEVSYHT